MMGYILSKINLLILVMSLFAIIAYFMFGVSSMAANYEAKLIVDKLARQAESLVSTETYCDSTQAVFPARIDVVGSSFYYAVIISTQEIPGTDNDKFLIFSVTKRANLSEVISSTKIRTNANIEIFSAIEENEDGVLVLISDNVEAAEQCIIDPQMAPSPYNKVIMKKEVKEGKQNLYIIPCSTDVELCGVNYADAEQISDCGSVGCNEDSEHFNCNIFGDV